MKVLFIVSRLHMGGIENMLLNLAQYYKNKDIEIHILCNLGGELDKEFLSFNVHLHQYKYKSNPINDVRSLFFLLREKEFDIVHSQLSHTSGFLALLTSFFKVLFLISVHNQIPTFKLHWQDNIFLNLLRKSYLLLHRFLSIKFSETIIGHSKANLSYYNKKWELKVGKYRVIENGINFLKLANSISLAPEKQKKLNLFCRDANAVIIHIGKFKEQKNHNFLIDVFSKTKPVENKYKLILMGSGDLMENIIERVSSEGIDENILFTGMEANILPYLNSSNVFFYPSLYEGFGNVLIEAQYKGVSICASDINPHYESVYSGFNKYFFDPNNKQDALNKLEMCMNSNLDFSDKEVIKEAAIFAKYFSIERMAEDLICFYKVLSDSNV